MNAQARLKLALHQKGVAEFEKQQMEKMLHSKEVQFAEATSTFRQEVNRLRGELLRYGWNGQIRNELIPYVTPNLEADSNTTDPLQKAEMIEGLKRELESQKQLSGIAGGMLSGIADNLTAASGRLDNSSWSIVNTYEGGWEFKRTNLTESSTAMAMSVNPTPSSSKLSSGGEPKCKSEVVQRSYELPSTSSTALLSFRHQSDADDEDRPINYSTHGDNDEDVEQFTSSSTSSESFSLVSLPSSKSSDPDYPASASSKNKSIGTWVSPSPRPGADCKARVKIEGEVRQKVSSNQSSLVGPSRSASFSKTKAKVSTSGPPKHGVANKTKLLCLCGRQFKRKQGLTCHINYANGSHEEQNCELCGNPFANKGLLAIHMSRKHGQASGSDPQAQTPVPAKRLHQDQFEALLSKRPQVKRERDLDLPDSPTRPCKITPRFLKSK